MWLFDINYSDLPGFIHKIPQAIENNNDELDELRALSLLSPKQVEKIGTLQSEAILGFITGEQLSLDYFHPNQIFIDLLQNVVGSEAPTDAELQAAAIEQKEGYINIIDRRVANRLDEETSPEDILGAFEIKEGRIVANSYQANENYLIFGNHGLMQLPASLHEALINALLSLKN
jgi:hypothetical protein